MYPRTEYEISEKELKEILEASKPTPVIYGNGGSVIGGSQQENANNAWKKLGEKLGFDYMTVRPINGKGNRFFTAVPSETEGQRKEREQREETEAKAERIKKLKDEIVEREKELKDLS